MKFNNDFKYDLKFGQIGEELIGSIFTDKTIEVKRDNWIYRSGNIAIEYESRGKPSGINKSLAEYWVFIFSGKFNDDIILIIETKRLKTIFDKYFEMGKIKAMGDNNTSLAVLIPVTEITNYKNYEQKTI
jgi:hypothetical protein